MRLSTVAHDCLEIHWAVPLAALAPVPLPLRFQVHEADDGTEWVFATLAAGHLDAVHVEPWSVPSLSYPQSVLQLAVTDEAGEPASFVRRLLVPFWTVPLVRLLGEGRPRAARLDLPRPSREPVPLVAQEDGWLWRVRSRRSFSVRAWPAPGASVPEGLPSLGSTEETLRYFRRRPRAFTRRADGTLESIRVEKGRGEAVRVRARVEVDDLLAEGFGLLPESRRGELAPVLHSAWLMPEVEMVYATDPGTVRPEPAVGRASTASARSMVYREASRPRS